MEKAYEIGTDLHVLFTDITQAHYMANREQHYGNLGFLGNWLIW
jgi:hypothetical protein